MARAKVSFYVIGLVTSSVSLLLSEHALNVEGTSTVVNKTVTNTLHGTNFQASNGRNRLV